MCKYVFVEKCYQEVRLKMVILRNLEVPNILWIVLAYNFEYQPTMLELGSQNNVFKTGTKWLCDIYSIIKTLTSGGKNVERNYHNLIHKQSAWMAIYLWNRTFVGAKRNRSQFSYQNAMFLIKFYAGEGFFFPPII